MMKNALLCVKTTGTSGNNTHCDTSAGRLGPERRRAHHRRGRRRRATTPTQSQSNNVIAGQGINIKSSDFQGGLIANKDIGVDTTSKMQGPMISVYHTVNAGQSNDLTFPPILFAPSGAAHPRPAARSQLLPPQQFGGG